MADQNFRVKRGLEVGIGGTVISALSTGKVGIGTTNPQYVLTVTTPGASETPGLSNVLGDFTANTNSYSQINTRNASSGANASTDIIATADTGTDSTNYIDLGINNSGYSAVGWTINGPLDGYLYTSDTNLSIGAASANKYVSVFTGGTAAANERLRVNDSGVGIGTTNPTAKLWVNGDGKFIGSVTSSGFYVDGNLIGSGSVTVGPIVGTSLSISGISTFSDQVKFEGNAPYNTFWDKSLGNGAFKWDADGFTPLKIYADGLVGYAEGANGFEIRVDGNNQKSLVATINQGVELYYNNSKKLETTEDGITVTGLTTTQNLSASGISTLGTVQISSGIVTATATSGVVTYYGDGSKLTGITAASGDSYLFNTGITNSFSATLDSIGDTDIITFPSTANKKYILYSINCTNVSIANTEVNVIGAFDFSGGQRSYFAWNIPISPNNSVEILKQPQVLNPSDAIRMRATDISRFGVNNAVQVNFAYQEVSDTDAKYLGVGLGTVGLGVTSPVTLYTSTSLPTVIQSIRLVNKTDSGDYPVSITISNGLSTTYLVKELIVPKYSSVEICEQPKRIEIGESIDVILGQSSTFNVQLSAKKIG